MKLIHEVLQEVRRLQVLVFISRSHGGAGPPATVDELAGWLGVPLDECAALLQELQEEGMVEALLSGPFPARAALSLTPVGAGWIAWMHLQAQKESGRDRPDPLPVGPRFPPPDVDGPRRRER